MGSRQWPTGAAAKPVGPSGRSAQIQRSERSSSVTTRRSLISQSAFILNPTFP